MTNEHKHNFFNFNEIKCFICYDRGYEQGKKDERERVNNIIDYFIDKQTELKIIVALGYLKVELMKK